MGSQQNKIQAVFDWQDAPQPFVPHHGKQAGSIRRVRRKKKGKHAKVEAELYICKEYSLAGVNSAHANGSRYVFGEYYVLGELLKGLKHPNIIDCVDFSYSPNSQVARLYTEYCRFGDLEQALRTRKARSKLDTQEAKHVLYQIACGLLYLHHGVYYTGNTLKIVSLPSVVREGDAPNGWVPILHRDIKPPNVFVAELADTCIQVKLGDFGIAKTETDGTDTYIGSRAYHAPEQRMEFQGPGRRRTTFKSDMYALGVTMQQVTIPNEEHLGASAEHAVILNQIIQDCLASNDIDRPSSGAIIDLLRPHIDSEDPSTITSKVLTRLTTSDTRGLTKQQAIRLKAEFTSYDELCQRCLHSGSNPGPEALLSFSSYVEDHAFPAWKSQAIQQVLPSMQPCLQGLVRDGGNGPHNNNAGVTRADPSPADTDKTARRDTNEDSIKDPITGPILSQLPAVSQSSLSILDSREREENEKAAEMHMLHELSSLPQVSSSGVPVRMLRSPEHLYHPYKPGVESSSGTPEPRLYSDWRTRYKLAQPHINFFSDGGDAHVNKPLQSSFVRAVKKNNANGILDSSGNAVDFSRRASPGPIPSTRRLGPSEPPTAPPSEHLRPVLERPAKTHPDARAKIAEAVARQKEEEAQLEREIEEMEIRERGRKNGNASIRRRKRRKRRKAKQKPKPRDPNVK
ncbi:hypothetical protein BST61_g6313 [Cercospora zeina]